jgi:hypothetical protein
VSAAEQIRAPTKADAVHCSPLCPAAYGPRVVVSRAMGAVLETQREHDDHHDHDDQEDVGGGRKIVHVIAHVAN